MIMIINKNRVSDLFQLVNILNFNRLLTKDREISLYETVRTIYF